MNNDLIACQQDISQTEERFTKVMSENVSPVNFKKESEFAMQLLEKNNFLVSTARRNPTSLKNAIVNIASIGLSLNPAERHAYLVPRDGMVCLDISYMGFCQLATEAGSIDWVQAKLVHRNDSFETSGLSKEPLHNFNPFGDRGECVGVYCVAKLKTGEYLTEIMSIGDCHSIRDRTSAWKAFESGKAKSCPWFTDEGEMMKKTVIKRAVKLWPKINMDRLNNAIHVVNEHEGIDFDQEKRDRADEVAAQDQKQIEADYAQRYDIIASITKLCGQLTVGFTTAQKMDFIESNLEVSKWSELIKKNVDDLKEMEINLSQMLQGENDE